MEFRLNEQKNIHFFSSIYIYTFLYLHQKKLFIFTCTHTIENSTDIVKDNVE